MDIDAVNGKNCNFCKALDLAQRANFGLEPMAFVLAFMAFVSYHEVADDDGGEEEGDADLGGDPHAVPHGLDPLPAEHAEHDHEAVHEVGEVPPGHVARPLLAHVGRVVLAEELHAHDGEDEDDDAEDEGEVPEGAHRLAHDGNQEIERRPGLGQFEDTELQTGKTTVFFSPRKTTLFFSPLL